MTERTPLTIEETEEEWKILVNRDDLSRLRSMLEALEVEDQEFIEHEGPIMSVGRPHRQIVIDVMNDDKDVVAQKESTSASEVDK